MALPTVLRTNVLHCDASDGPTDAADKSPDADSPTDSTDKDSTTVDIAASYDIAKLQRRVSNRIVYRLDRVVVLDR